MSFATRRLLLGFVPWMALVSVVGVRAAANQAVHPHTAALSGMPQGVPLFCANTTVTSVATGRWSTPTTWSTGKVPGAGDRIAIDKAHAITYDTVSDARIDCVEVRGKLAFSTNTNTRMRVVTVLVPEGGSLEVGAASHPVVPEAVAEIVIADQLFDPTVDPSQVGHGIVVLGKFTMHGAAKTPTFVRLAQEPLAGQTRLTVERPVTGWTPGDSLVVPDTRQLRAGEPAPNDRPQHETVRVASISATHIMLTAPLTFDHKGARDAVGAVEFLPHVGNLSRNVVVRSENPRGIRGHTMFLSHAEVDIRFALFEELGRTKLGILDTTEFDSAGNVAKIGTNQIGRYAVHFHHDFGPLTTPANGYQFTLVGNAVNGASKWGVTVHRSHYGLIMDNVVFNTRGAGIVTEDGSESFNVFEHNFSVRTTGSTDAGNGYSATLPNPGGEGSAFWFRGPNNYIRNNVAANAAESGFGLPVTALGTIRVPKNKGADTSRASESVALDTSRAPVLEFAGNEAYGAIRNGVTWAWSGLMSGVTVWHSSRHGVTAMPNDTLTIDKLTVRGDPALLGNAVERPVGVWVANYAGKTIAVGRANVQGLRVGVQSPFFYGRAPESTGTGSLTVEDSYFSSSVGVSVATSYVDDNKDGHPLKTAIVRNSVFDALAVKGVGEKAEGVSMNYGMTPGDERPRAPLLVYEYNRQPNNDFSVYYSLEAPPVVAPCHDVVPGIGGWVCRQK